MPAGRGRRRHAEDQPRQVEQTGRSVPRHQTVAHLTARDAALSNAFGELSRADGVLPAELSLERTTYLLCIARQCVREMFGLLENWRGPHINDWRDWPVKEAEREELAESLLLVQERKGRRSTLQLHVAHLRKVAIANNRNELELMLSRQSVALSDVLGSHNEVYRKVVRMLRTKRGCTHGDKIFCPVGASEGGYVGDFTSALTDAYRFAGQTDTPLLWALRPGGHRAVVSWERPLELDEPRSWTRCTLNPPQHSALAGLERNLELISGPPGTGKSTTILYLVKECTPPEEPVILTAVQNRAIEALIEKFVASNTPFIVVGRRPTGMSCDHTLDAQIERTDEVKALKREGSLLIKVQVALTELLNAHQTALFNPEPAQTSTRGRAREQLVNELMVSATTGEASAAWHKSTFRDSRAYELWQRDFTEDQQHRCAFAREELQVLVKAHVRAISTFVYEPLSSLALSLMRSPLSLSCLALSLMLSSLSRA